MLKGNGANPGRRRWLAAIAFVAVAALVLFGAHVLSAGGHAMGLAPGGVGALTQTSSPGYAGSAACSSCHASETAAWLGSHHAHAMQAAADDTVLGDFSGAQISFKSSTGRFFRDGDRFMVETEGPDGKKAAFAVTHTFGVAPLQQYLVTFPDGRLQALPWAWDTRPKAAGGQRWFHLYQNEPILASDPLHWTRLLQNWNFMCAECHSTDLRKNYDAATNSYHTEFSEISVGCESCHGPGAGHIAWANGGRDPAVAWKGFASIAARRPAADWTADPATGSPAHGVSRPVGDEVEVCAHCHSRRGILAEHWRPGQPLTDTHLPTFLDAGLFEDDGQMKDEVFNDHSFKQSLMYQRGVVCTDCHNPHSGAPKLAGAAVCSQCHLPAKFAVPAHTGHPAGPGSPDCISCHMPVRSYMVVDPRHDHSFRIPRPDISVLYGTPNACNDCHKDKTASWAAEAVERWFGPQRKGLQNWTAAIHGARAGDPASRALLIALAGDATVPAVARATIINEMQRVPSAATDAATTAALADPDPLVRIAALRGERGVPADLLWQRANPLLSDPIAGVRMQTCQTLAGQPTDILPAADRTRLYAACTEYEASQRLNEDRPEGRANLADFLRRRGSITAAEDELLGGLKLEPASVPLSVNLADLYRAEGRDDEGEGVLRKAIALTPDSAALHHALGLTLIRRKQYADAVKQLGRAQVLAPDEPRYAYVYAVALQSTGDKETARRVVSGALTRNPADPQLLSWALQDAMSNGDSGRALPFARELAAVRPDDAAVAQLAAKLQGK